MSNYWSHNSNREHLFWFMDKWLAGESITEEDVEENITGNTLPLFSHPFTTISAYAKERKSYPPFLEALKHGLPPLPPETSHFESIYVGVREFERAGLKIASDSLWRNLEGACFVVVKLEYADRAWFRGLEKVSCWTLDAENATEALPFEHFPKLDNPKDYVFLTLADCSEPTILGETFAEYLKTAQAERIDLYFRGKFLKDLEPSVLECLCAKFGGFRLRMVDSSLTSGFLDSHSEAFERVASGEMGILPLRATRRHPALRAKQEEILLNRKFTVETETPPFRKMLWASQVYPGVCWHSNEQAFRKWERKLKW